MSTILDALRKAQEDTRGARDENRVDPFPGGQGPTSPRGRGPRRLLVWLAAVAAVLAVAFVGGLALGRRVTALFGGGGTETAAAPATAQDKHSPEKASVARGEPDQGRPAKPAPAPAQGDRLAASRPARVAPAERAATQPDASAAKQGMHVFGPVDGGEGQSDSDQERAKRLQQLRERMLQARQQARSGDKPLVPIVAPPPKEPPAAPAHEAQVAVAAREGAGSPAGSPVAAPGGSAVSAAPAPDLHAAEEARARPAAPQPGTREPVQVAAASRPAAPVPAAPSVAAPASQAAAVRDALAKVGAGPVGVSVTQHDEGAAPGVPAGAEAHQAENPHTTVASLTPPQPAAPAAPPVLRHSPGGAPQVAINILQWSTEPGRRFAFVTVDGGNMTQVREGDHIGPLTVKHIHEQMIEFGYNDSSFLLRAN